MIRVPDLETRSSAGADSSSHVNCESRESHNGTKSCDVDLEKNQTGAARFEVPHAFRVTGHSSIAVFVLSQREKAKISLRSVATRSGSSYVGLT